MRRPVDFSSAGTARGWRSPYSFGESLLCLQLTFDLSPFWGQGCFCDCCSLAPREVSFCCVEVDGLDGEGLVLEELLDDEDDGGFEGVVWACAVPHRGQCLSAC